MANSAHKDTQTLKQINITRSGVSFAYENEYGHSMGYVDDGLKSGEKMVFWVEDGELMYDRQRGSVVTCIEAEAVKANLKIKVEDYVMTCIHAIQFAAREGLTQEEMDDLVQLATKIAGRYNRGGRDSTVNKGDPK